MTLYLHRLPLRLSALTRWAGERGWTHPRGGSFDAGRALHHLLSETFGKGVLQPFRVMAPARRDQASLYAYSPQSGEALRDMAATIALPEALAVIPPDTLQSKPMPAFFPDQRLGVDVLTRPVRRLRQPLDRFGAGDEIDVWLLDRLRNHPDGPPAEGGIRRDQAYLDWLGEMLAKGGAVLEPATSTVAGMERRRIARGGRSVEGPDVTFHATITVTDPAAFQGMLARGLGRHCAYGYGMMLLRAPGSQAPKC